jgi:hypothetical protein
VIRISSVPELLVQQQDVLEIVGAAVTERMGTGPELLGLNPLWGKYGATTTTGTIGTMTGRGLTLPCLDGATVSPLCVGVAVPSGVKEGTAEGEAEGLLVGLLEGLEEGDAEAVAVGRYVGLDVGTMMYRHVVKSGSSINVHTLAQQ